MKPTPTPSTAIMVSDGTALVGDVSRLFGATALATAAPPPESTRFKLLGVMASPDASAGRLPGVALISVDGKPARAYKPGARVEDQLVLRTVGVRSAGLGPNDGPVAFTLEIPRPVEAATGTLAPVDPAQIQYSQEAMRATIAPPPVIHPPSIPGVASEAEPSGPGGGNSRGRRPGGMGGPSAPQPPQ